MLTAISLIVDGRLPINWTTRVVVLGFCPSAPRWPVPYLAYIQTRDWPIRFRTFFVCAPFTAPASRSTLHPKRYSETAHKAPAKPGRKLMHSGAHTRSIVIAAKLQSTKRIWERELMRSGANTRSIIVVAKLRLRVLERKLMLSRGPIIVAAKLRLIARRWELIYTRLRGGKAPPRLLSL